MMVFNMCFIYPLVIKVVFRQYATKSLTYLQINPIFGEEKSDGLCEFNIKAN